MMTKHRVLISQRQEVQPFSEASRRMKITMATIDHFIRKHLQANPREVRLTYDTLAEAQTAIRRIHEAVPFSKACYKLDTIPIRIYNMPESEFEHYDLFDAMTPVDFNIKN